MIMHGPKGKAELLNRLFSYDFQGDWRALGPGVTMNRVRPHVVQLRFPDVDRTFNLTVHIPRVEKQTKVSAGILSEGKAPSSPTNGKQKQKQARRTPAHTDH